MKHDFPVWPLALIASGLGMLCITAPTNRSLMILFYVVSVCLVLLFAGLQDSTRRQLQRHQDALRWFSEHIKIDDRDLTKGEEVPEDLQFLLDD
jgi:hypothetical protein